MRTLTHPLDRVYCLGEQIEEAIDGKDWLRLTELVEQRTSIIRRLEAMHDGRIGLGLSPEEERERIETLVDQQDRLIGQMRKVRGEVEKPFTRVERLNHERELLDRSSSQPKSVVSPNRGS